jgi:hypothetical protein
LDPETEILKNTGSRPSYYHEMSKYTNLWILKEHWYNGETGVSG